MIILQTYDALVYVTWQMNFKYKLSCIKTLNWFVNNYSPLGLKTKHMPLLQYRLPVGFGPSSKT